MKTKIQIEIESKDSFEVFADEADIGKKDAPLIDIADDIHKEIVSDILTIVKKGAQKYIRSFPDELANYAEGSDDVEDYGLIIKIDNKEV